MKAKLALRYNVLSSCCLCCNHRTRVASWHQVTSHHSSWHQVTSHHSSCHQVTSHHSSWHQVTSHHSSWHQVTSHHSSWHQVTSHHSSWHQVTSHHSSWHQVTPHLPCAKLAAIHLPPAWPAAACDLTAARGWRPGSSWCQGWARWRAPDRCRPSVARRPVPAGFLSEEWSAAGNDTTNQFPRHKHRGLWGLVHALTTTTMPKTTQTLSETWIIYAQDHTNFVWNLNHLCPRPHKLSEAAIIYAQDHTNFVRN